MMTACNWLTSITQKITKKIVIVRECPKQRMFDSLTPIGSTLQKIPPAKEKSEPSSQFRIKLAKWSRWGIHDSRTAGRCHWRLKNIPCYKRGIVQLLLDFLKHNYSLKYTRKCSSHLYSTDKYLAWSVTSIMFLIYSRSPVR
jgi:hypothetical protein